MRNLRQFGMDFKKATTFFTDRPAARFAEVRAAVDFQLYLTQQRDVCNNTICRPEISYTFKAIS